MDEVEIALFNDNHVTIKLQYIKNKIYTTTSFNVDFLVNHITVFKRTIPKKKYNEKKKHIRVQKLKNLLNK